MSTGKTNSQIAKLIYAYEGVKPEAPKSKRNKLIKPRYFSGIYKGERNKELWSEVYEYLNGTYDLEYVKKIYLNSDGGAWIDAQGVHLGEITHVLDEFHISKYILRATGHLLDSTADARSELYQVLRNGDKRKLKRVEQMSHLRAYYWNKEDMLELVRYQKQEMAKAAGCEEIILGARQVLVKKPRTEKELRKYFDTTNKTLSASQVGKRAWFKSHIWDL